MVGTPAGIVAEEELQSVERPKHDEDLVEMAGVARFGMLFPTGPQVRLGPVRVLRLSRSVYECEVASRLRHRAAFPYVRGNQDGGLGPTGRVRIATLQLVSAGTVSTFVARFRLRRRSATLADRRWTMGHPRGGDSAKRATGTLAGKQPVHWPVQKRRTDFNPDELATFLFTTREGGRGIVQVFPKDLDTDRYRLRYRMWLTAPKADQRARRRTTDR